MLPMMLQPKPDTSHLLYRVMTRGYVIMVRHNTGR